MLYLAIGIYNWDSESRGLSKADAILFLGYIFSKTQILSDFTSDNEHTNTL